MKTCAKCGQTKPLDKFYRRKVSKDGLASICKLCDSNSHAERIKKESTRERHLKRSKEWRKNNSATESLKEYRAKNKLRTIAHRTVAKMIRKGLLHQEPCEVCNNMPTEAHHDDYSIPLDVRWLCQSCHKKHHRELRNAER